MLKRGHKRARSTANQPCWVFDIRLKDFWMLPQITEAYKFPRFARSNLMLDAQNNNLKWSSKENVTHKPAIEEEDLQKLKTSEVFSLSSPRSLLRNIWFHVLFFCRRGREGQRSLITKSFKFESDAAGRNYATMSHDELSKNHPGGLKDVESTEKEARMYKTEDQGDGYKALKLYLQKVNPNCTAFFQYPKKNCRAEDAVWYEARPLGMNSLAKMMKIISEEARLPKIYTNHCVKATAITLWSNAGISNRHIMAISGHRSEQSLVSYNSWPSTSQLHNCGQVLSKAFSASTNNQSHPTEVSQSQQLSMFQTKQVAPKSLFSDCSVQNVHIVFNGSSSGFQSIFKWQFSTFWLFCIPFKVYIRIVPIVSYRPQKELFLIDISADFRKCKYFLIEWTALLCNSWMKFRKPVFSCHVRLHKHFRVVKRN